MRVDCLNCLEPMKPREGKKFCGTKCRIAYWKNPRSSGKLAAQIDKRVEKKLEEMGFIKLLQNARQRGEL